MRITFELPDWVDGTNIRVFAGINMAARKLVGRPPETKVVQCGYCGKCCINCEYLEERHGYKQPNGEWAWMCSLNEDRPQSCANSDGFPEDCQIVWEESGTVHTD
jgi:hypothetical protein